MASRAPGKMKPTDATKTYRYLRIGMVLAVVLLAASIGIERDKVDCWQTSISAYYYTPVRAIFVGGMIAVGFSLIVIKGRTSWEDICLNVAGMLAPVVAIAPTTDVGDCWSVEPNPLPVIDGSLASWVVTNVNNNFHALLIAGAVSLVVAVVVAIAVNRGVGALLEGPARGTTLSLAVTAVMLAVGWWLIADWSAFYSRAHGIAAVLMFAFLIGAVAGKAVEHRRKSTAYFPIYSSIAVLMVVGGIAVPWLRIGGEHTVLVLEAYEILLFAAFWIVQTVENWDEEVMSSSLAGAGPGVRG